MEIITSIAEMRRWVKMAGKKGHSVGLVPTMGYLHQGHLSLVRRAREENEAVVMSIFVNPLQFGPQEDYSSYPRDLRRDCQMASEAGADVVFAPAVEEMYPVYPQLTSVQVSRITERLCGASRPGHFSGVATVVTKLFNIVQPDRAYFGQKDYQQVQVIRRMAADLNMPVIIRTVPIVREEDGLAMSSRNSYLSPSERKQALCLSASLKICQEMFENGERNVFSLIEAMKKRIAREPAAMIDYVEICAADTLEPLETIDRPAVVAIAVKIGKPRLIDNMLLEE